MKLFKKLALILSAAMMITLIPANQANADVKTAKLAFQNAKSAAECITSFELAVGQEQDLKYYGVSDWRTTEIGWESSNESVAKVDKKGNVTAVGVGSAQIIFRAKGYTSIPTTVIVTASSYPVYLAEQYTGVKYTAYNLTVGKSVDFKFIGATGWSATRYACTWASSNESVATVDSKGLVTARAEGSTKIVLTIIDKKTGKVAYNVRPCTVIVGAKATATATPVPSKTPTPVPQNSAFTVKQTAYNAATVTFKNTAVKDTDINLVVEGNTNYIFTKTAVKNGAIDVTFSYALENGKEYTIVNGTDKYTFKASVGTVAKVGLEYESCGKAGVAYENETTKLTPVAYDANGIKLNTSGIKVYEEYSGYEYEMYAPYELYAGEAGSKYTYTVKYVSGSTTVSQKVTITAQKQPPYSLTVTEAKLSKVGETTKTGTSSLIACIGDDGTLGFALKLKDSKGEVIDVVAGTQLESEHGYMYFEGTNDNILMVDEAGILYPIAKGTASVRAYFVNTDEFNEVKTLLGTYSVRVDGARYISRVTCTIDGPQGTKLSSEAGANNYNQLKLVYKFFDQNGNLIKPSEVTVYETAVKSGSADADGYASVGALTPNPENPDEGIIIVTGQNGFSASESRRAITVTSVFEYNSANNDGKTYRHTSSQLTVFNMGASVTPGAEAVLTSDSAKGLGISEGPGVLTVTGMLIETVNGAMGNIVTLKDEYTQFKNLTTTERATKITNGDWALGDIFYEVTINSKAPAAGELTVAGNQLTVKVRDAYDFTSSPEAIIASSTAIKKLTAKSVNIKFWKLAGTAASPRFESFKQISTSLRNSDAASTATIVIPADKAVEYLPSDASGMEDWIMNHCVITINNGLTGKTMVLSKPEDYAEVSMRVKNFVSYTTTSRCGGITIFVPNKAEGATAWQAVDIASSSFTLTQKK